VKELARLNALLSIPIDDEVLKEKAILFTDELKSWSSETITMAIREHCRKSRFFPSLSEIINNCTDASISIAYSRQRERAQLPMPDSLPEEVVINNLKQIERIKQTVFKKIPDNSRHLKKIKAQCREIKKCLTERG